jgi:hypothetical protein
MLTAALIRLCIGATVRIDDLFVSKLFLYPEKMLHDDTIACPNPDATAEATAWAQFSKLP